MTEFIAVENFEAWRTTARRLLQTETRPEAVAWNQVSQQKTLFGGTDPNDSSRPYISQKQISVPPDFLQLAKTIASHRDEDRWELLYRMVWRITHGERHLLEDTTDEDTLRLIRMRKAISRDVHKMKAFVRFRKVIVQDETRYIAWHRPDHRIVRLAAPFFARRFPEMHWTILTPDESVEWNLSELVFGPGVPASEAPQADELEDLWKTYYAATFNPARIKVSMMKREMPVRYWPTMPETELIPELLQQANQRVEKMLENTEGFQQTASHFRPDVLDLTALRQASRFCTACDLHEQATQVVFGVGPRDARLMIVGEQPGDQEDLAGEPFIGPAGELLDELLQEAGLEREKIYLTNTVKHFKFAKREQRRLHVKPGSREISACRPWLEAELEVVKPQTLFCLGATAAQALLGRDFRISQQRGQIFASEWCTTTIASWHPSAILRMQDPIRKSQMRAELIRDLQSAAG